VISLIIRDINKKMKQTLILLGLSAVAFAHTGIKTRLGQVKSNTLAEQCSCSIAANSTGSGLPGLSQGTLNSWAQGGSISQGETISTVPDTEVTEAGASECCSCNTGSQSAASSGSKTRHYDILGSITIAESVEWAESGNSSSNSAGEARKQSTSEESNTSNSGSGAPNGGCVTVCASNGTLAL
jgi:hypothetical protein